MTDTERANLRARLRPVISAVAARLSGAGRALLVIDGMCGAGKSTAADIIAREIDAPVLRMDDFFLPPEMRAPQRLSQPGGNVHYERFEAEALRNIFSGEGFSYGAFDCKTGDVSVRRVDKSDAYIIEGSYALHPRFCAAYSALGAIRVFMSVDEEEQKRRILARGGPDALYGFEAKWIPLEKTYFEAYHIKERADIAL